MHAAWTPGRLPTCRGRPRGTPRLGRGGVSLFALLLAACGETPVTPEPLRFGASAAAASVGTIAYVTNANSDDVTVIDLAANAAIGTIVVGDRPVGVAFSPDGKRAFVAEQSDSSLAVIDVTSSTVIDRILLDGRPVKVMLTRDGRQVYVPLFDADVVAIIDVATGWVTNLPVGDNPSGIDVTPDGRFAYVTNADDNSVSVIETTTQTIVATIDVGVGSTARVLPVCVAISPDGSLAYVTNFWNDEVVAIDIATNAVVSRIGGFSAPNGVTFHPSGAVAYVTNFFASGVPGDWITVVDAAQHVALRTVPTGAGPTDVKIDPDGRAAYVTNLVDNTVSVIGLETEAELALVSVGVTPLIVAFRPPPAAGVEGLEAFVEALVASGSLDEGAASGLLAVLRNVLASIVNDRPNAANLLAAFIQQVNGMANAGILTSSDASEMVASAEATASRLES